MDKGATASRSETGGRFLHNTEASPKEAPRPRRSEHGKLQGQERWAWRKESRARSDSRGPGLASRDGNSWRFCILFPVAEGRGVNQMAHSPQKEEVNSVVFLTIIHLWANQSPLLSSSFQKTIKTRRLFLALKMERDLLWDITRSKLRSLRV